MCFEGRALLAEYIRATKEHAKATKHLATLAGRASLSLFSEVLAETEKARRVCERTRLAFRSHRAEHKC